ncbi:hypothetical protein DPMN_060684 [Dreissena polymorpha]|uniref:Uncharacterized protein n=1 Tax=Dreissena polymorpha TaxID=45954 RepID=A0A9D4HHS6_DREPO|nr:hypothetical protein DPMN_060684 [Dreissena polymorpha]
MYYQVCVASLNFDFKGQHITDIRYHRNSDIVISKGTQHYTVISTCRVLSAMMEQYIRFPESRHELKIIAYGFHE